MPTVIDKLFEIFSRFGDRKYGEDISLMAHMLQSAHFATEAGAEPTLIIAALLHDFGYFLFDGDEHAAEVGINTSHESLGARFLGRHFPPAITGPISLHVAAKAYLCAVEPSYYEALSYASKQSLELQGGRLNQRGIETFLASPFAAAAIRLRRFDDAGKQLGMEVPMLESYRVLLTAFVR